MANNNGGVPKVIACTADSDPVFGFVNYDIKSQSFAAGSGIEISISGNVMWLYAMRDHSGRAGHFGYHLSGAVGQKVGSSGAAIVGWALDGAAAAGALIRVKFDGVPAFSFA